MAVKALWASWLEDTGRAFDGVAEGYHDSNAANSILREMRGRALAAAMALVSPGARVLDLGCGPGTDAEVLARSGYDVTAIDWSPGMVAQATRRLTRGGLRGRVEIRRLGIQELARLPSAPFDVAYSNFGPLNCVPDLRQAAPLIHECLRPGGWLVASVIGRVCPWEVGTYLARGDLERIRVRFARGFVPVPLGGRTVWTRYYTPSEFERAFSRAGFRRVSLRSLGLFVPPPYLDGFAGRHPLLASALQRIEDAVGHLPLFRQWGDHFLIVLQRD